MSINIFDNYIRQKPKAHTISLLKEVLLGSRRIEKLGDGLQLILCTQPNWEIQVLHEEHNEEYVSLIKRKDEDHNEYYELSANINNPYIAGKAIQQILTYIPSGGIILESQSLSLDSYKLLINQIGHNNNFTYKFDGYITLNNEGKFNRRSHLNTNSINDNHNNMTFNHSGSAQKVIHIINNRLIDNGLNNYQAHLGTRIHEQKVLRYYIMIPNFQITKK